MKDLTELNLESLSQHEGLEEYRDQKWLVHLRWMFDNQPELVRSLHRLGKLGLWVDGKNQEALELESRLLDQGMPKDQVSEIVLGTIMAPADGPAMSENPPQPIPSSERRKIKADLLEV
jgi:hypothetical protein